MPMSEGARFPIIGIGASAGGLEALELFLRGVPASSGMAFVIVQHLDPTHTTLLAELLQRATAMPVREVTDNLPVQPDHVYTIPPNKDLSILRGVLHLLEPAARRGLRLPIDAFFRTLAADMGARSTGVILSGMGTDGTLGLKAIREQSGATFVQDPLTAKFDGMPSSAIAAGWADVVAPAETLPERILAFRRLVKAPGRSALVETPDAEAVLDKVLILIRAQTGHDFSQYKRNTLYRRVERRMAIHQIDTLRHYVRFLQENPQECELLFKEMLIGVTSFFRDARAWETLQSEVVTSLVRKHDPQQPIRAWIAGCASGEEAFSLAILLRESMEHSVVSSARSIRIFATDLDQDAIAKARTGSYPPVIARDISPERLQRFFVATTDGYRVTKVVRESVTFAPHNVTVDPPFTRLDLVSCRNLLIYLTPVLQQRLIQLFHYSLNPNGVLMLGDSETIGPATHLFEPIEGKGRLYRRLESDVRSALIDFPHSQSQGRTGAPVKRPKPEQESLPTAAEQLLLQQCAPPAVIVDAAGDIVYINGRTGRYLEPAAGKTNWNVLAMAHAGLQDELRGAFAAAKTQEDPVVRRPVFIAGNGRGQAIELRVQAIRQPGALQGLFLMVFVDIETVPVVAPVVVDGVEAAADPAMADAQTASLAQELTQVRRELQRTRDDSSSSEEELNSANEELQSTNEELPSTNEELTTSKEEMQSMNEELQTLNHELQARLDELARLSTDIKNLLENTEIVTIFLDRDLNVRLFTAGSNRIFRLIPSDVGRPITNFASGLDYPALAADAREVLKTLMPHEQQAQTPDGQWFQARIMPYRTLSNTVDGVAITFTDITASKTLERTLRETQAGLERHIGDQAILLERATKTSDKDGAA